MLAQNSFNMYNTNHGLDGYCLLYYVPDNKIYFNEHDLVTHQVIPYCLRPLEDIIFMKSFDVRNESCFNFVDLRKKNISSQQLLSWSASIDLAEDYEMFLNDLSNASTTSNNDMLFYNCTAPWFGPRCRFAFELSINTSFDDIVSYTFKSKRTASNNATVPCYNHLNCQSLSFCLDWREICDGKIDCIDESDEINCWQLEVNECNDNEYRCYNAQCIPQEFLRDNPLNPDCLDHTDEPVFIYDTTISCSQNPSFRCEEFICRPGTDNFPCGDGQCIDQMAFKCENSRNSISCTDTCSTGMACILKINDQCSICNSMDYDECDSFCTINKCGENNCSEFYEFPSNSIVFGHVRFLFSSYERHMSVHGISLPNYVCYDERLCADFLPATEHLNGLTCRLRYDLRLKETIYSTLDLFLSAIKDRFRLCLTTFNKIPYRNNSITYRCFNSSKLISKYRLVDGIQDCPLSDDETFNESCSLKDAHHRYKCSINGTSKCFASLIIDDGKIDCDDGKDENQRKNIPIYLREIHFPVICDGIHHFTSIDGQNETDETNCEYWECNNTYTRCDGFWSCKNGADEVGCSQLNCSEFEHDCVFRNDTTKISCLPISHAGDGAIDCLGATDERRQCRIVDQYSQQYGFQCLNISNTCVDSFDLCNQIKNCINGDDEVFCNNPRLPICFSDPTSRTDVENFLCKFTEYMTVPYVVHFVLHDMPTYPRQLIDGNILVPLPTKNKTEIPSRNDVVDITSVDLWRCNRGISILTRMNDNKLKPMCLCPPSYYGDECQFQNQRVSLTVQIRATSDWRSMFILFITIIDNERNIQSHDRIEYLPIRDCNAKFDIYLLYSTRPKNTSKTYSVQIDAFEQLKFQHRASWIFPLQFSFLPVHRLPVLLTIPNDLIAKSAPNCQPPCLHGHCVNYVNNPINVTFCRCFPNWSGAQCNIQHTCNCASHSLCISNSICLCSLNHYGSRCHLLRSSCHSDYCFNGGQCVSSDERGKALYLNEPTCICPIEYSGNRCKRRQSRIHVSFHKQLTIPQSLLIHLITVEEEANPSQTSTMKKISFDQNSVTLFTSSIFNIALVEFSKDYYLIILREKPIDSIDISTEIIPSHRCLSIDELFDKTIFDQHLLRRIKFYHLPCRERFELICFYDPEHLCFCDNYHRANCFKFNYNRTYDCHGYNLCENDGQCFEDDPICPTSSICVCPQCYFGSRCQFSTKGSTLSLDIILGYRIQLNLKINQQPLIVKFGIALTIIIFIVGWISNLCSYLTFRSKQTRIVGCGFYLFTLSITSLITISVLTIKFWLLIAAQLGSINNHLFLNIQCRSMDFILRVLISTGDWLNACIAIERMINISRGVNFNTTKSIRAAKWMIGIVYLFTTCTYLHDPIYRHLVDDEEEKRTWCVTKYPSHIQIYDWIVNIFHFSLPFTINCISGIIIIITATRTRSNVQKKQSYRTILQQQLSFHKHLLISPLILICLAIPRLIISFLAGCMKSTRDSWFYLIGYFISFISPILTFVIFILPSKMYRKVFNESIKSFFRR